MAIPVTVPDSLKRKKNITDSNKRKGWSTPYGFLDFMHPVTYEEACKEGKKLDEFAKELWRKHGENND